jgi:choline-sulfatase
MRKPNILFIMADQLSGPVLPFHGNMALKAPHLAALAARSHVFDNAYCNFPLCAPARFALMAGQYATRIGAFDNACEFAADTPTLPYYLAGMGYRTILSGKMHFIGPDQQHGFQERLTTDIYPADFSWTADWSKGEFGYLKSGQNLKTIIDSGECFRSLQIDYDDDVEAKAVQRLYDLAREDSGPFFMCVSFTHPHPPFHTTPEYLARYDASSINLPQTARVPFDEMDMLSRWIQFSHGLDRVGPTDNQTRRARHAYYAMVSYVDDKVGRLLQTLQRAGFDDETVVVFTSDHGDMLGERGMWFKRSFFDWSVKVPLLISLPGQRVEQRISNLASHVDLLPTLVDLAQGGVCSTWVEQLDGQSLVPLLGPAQTSDSRTVFVEYTAEGVVGPCCMLRRGPFKYIYTYGYPDLLFDLSNDVGELNDISQVRPELTSELRHLALQRWKPEEVKSRVLASQARRKFIKALPAEVQPVWDFQSTVDDTKRYVRRGSGPKEKQRWPRPGGPLS